MFVGEMCCLVAYFVSLFIQRLRWRRRHRKVNDVQKPQKALVETDGRHKLEKIDEVSAEVENNDQMSLQSGASTIPTIPRFNYLLFAVPAFCDVCATSIQYFGLTLTSASAYQMLRGAVIIFTGLFSILCLHVKLRLFKWIGMLLVVIGLVVVGVADILYVDDTKGKTRLQILVGWFFLPVTYSFWRIRIFLVRYAT
ncbi:unnamed protein product [Gongylonema pulchrum]|uniref:EamA domain-containing protein n=1 Tax=Gongylonema pulchrum TaxID=637853 RepID=A0A183DW91_9BILA|nr:unnamed protein product [Gongylonema pulchrum]